MPLVPLETWLLRAPLLGVDALTCAGRALERDPLGAEALALASPGLAAAKASDARARAVDRYGRRAATRPTPHGLLAGVATGTLGATTWIATGTPSARRTPSWAALAALGDSLRAERAARPRVRVAPSIVTGAFEHVVIVGAEEVRVARDDVVDAVVAAAVRWIGRARAVDVARRAGADEPEVMIDGLVDVGLLHHDLRPPLVGPPPEEWMRARLAGTPWADAVDALARDAAVLVHRPRVAVLAQATVERAAALAGLLFRLQDALHPPAAERLLEPALPEALAAIDAIVGPGAVRVDDLIAGRLGVTLGESEGPPAPAAPAALTGLLVDALASGLPEVALDPDALDAALPDVELPRTFELFLQGAAGPSSGKARRASPRPREGDGWLLGLHAPAGSTWGRFAHALGAPLTEALAQLDAREREAAPSEERLDVAWSPSSTLADVVAHPPVRARTLALASWPDDAVPAVTPAELELVADPSRAAPLTLRAGDRAVAPAPLARLRASTAPPGATRLLLGWSLVRQHAPWALVWPAALVAAHTPRITLDGFVIAPASWRLPAKRDRRALAAWRRAAKPPRWVVVGAEDELLAVDLDAADAARDLEGHDRVTELWPPPDRTLDRDGRRVEAVVAVVDVPDDDERASAETPAARVELASRSAATAPSIPCPADAPPEPDVTTFKLYGAADAQDRLLAALAPVLIRAERRGGPLRAWWFQRFVEPPGERAHLRLRLALRAAGADSRAVIADVLDDARRAGDLVDVSAGDYRREHGRFGAQAAAVDAVFASDSRLVVDLLATPLDEDCDLLELAVRAADALARGLGLDAPARLALAQRLRAATARDLPDRDEALAELRDRRVRLDAALTGTLDDAAAPAFAAHLTRLARLRVDAAHLPVLIHLGAVRLAGPAPVLEATAALAWERTLASLRARSR